MKKKIILILMIAALLVLSGCAANRQLQSKIDKLEQEKEQLINNKKEYSQFLSDMYSKIEETSVNGESIDSNEALTDEIEILREENKRLKAEIEKQRKYISDMYNLIEKEKK